MKNIDKPYRDCIREVTRQLAITYNLFSTYKFDLSKTDITEAIILRLNAYYSAQNDIKELLEKGYAAAASDFFVETILFFTKLYLQQELPHLSAVSEKEILIERYRKDNGKIRREVIRPDITIKNANEIFAIIECKTQLGRSRYSWRTEYNDKKEKLKQKFPNAKTFLMVMTEDNWGGFGNDSKVGTEYFALLKDKVWPTNYQDNTQIRTGIEVLFRQLS